ncbi:MAG: endonuclease/exonuclease/phosphatase family protein [Litoreibacter sp.]|nr:endonuclease/exonuclease/phosphatase family protein [Litoreibacter sp.]
MTYNAELSRKGPGLLVRDLMRFEDELLVATVTRIARLRPDVIALQSVDYDRQGVALSLLQTRLDELGHAMPHAFALAPNTGLSTGFDLDRDGKLDTARDRQGYGLFRGQGGMALLSRFPIRGEFAQDFSATIWADVENPNLPEDYFTEDELRILKLHDIGAWQVSVALPSGDVEVLMVQTGPPVFDGPEDRNGRRNSDQIAFWHQAIARQKGRFVLLGGLNNDPVDGQGLKPALHALLRDARVQDPQPKAPGLEGADAVDTVDWGRDIGSLRVDYILPSAGLRVHAAAVERGQQTGDLGPWTAHKPVWVDLFWE